MSRKNYQPGSNRTDNTIIPYETTNFSAGIVKEQTPDNALADAYDVIIYPDAWQGREGCQVYGIPIPPMDDRTGYTATKTGNVITSPDPIFTEDDPSNYFVFPGSPDTHYVMIEYISEYQIRVYSDGDHITTQNCYIRGRTNLMQWHKILRRWVFMWGQQIYIAKYDLQGFTRCRIISRDLPNNTVSGYDDFDEFSALLFNSNGMLRIDFESTTPLVYKINVPIPDSAIPDIAETVNSEFNYHYLYSGARLYETGNIVNRLSPSRIEQETGTNIWDESYRDYGDVYTDDPIGSTEDTYGIITCGVLGAPYDNYGGWAALANPGSFRVRCYDDGNLYEIVVPFDNVINMSEVAAAIQNGLRDFYPYATCRFNAGRLIITTGRDSKYRFMEYVSAGTAAGTTNIATIMGGTQAAGAVVASEYVKVSQIVGPLYVPSIPNTTPQEYQWHLTHLPVYRSKDLLGRYKLSDRADQFNNPNDLMWVDDVRTCGAFFGVLYYYESSNYMYFAAEYGEFDGSEVGSVLEFENGMRFEIIGIYGALIAMLSAGSFYYGYDIVDEMAAAIGNGRVFRAYQVDDIVYRTRGDIFTEADERKPMKFATGYWAYAIEYLDANRMRVADSQSKSVMGMTIDPVYRYFYDTVDDETLNTRMTRLKLKQRFWQNMPNGNVGKVTPGLIFTAIRGDGNLNYGQIPDTLEYLHGFHDRGYQVTKKINDDIQFMWLFQDVLIIWTSRKTWRWSTGSYQYITNPYTKDAILQIVGLDITDEDRGCFDWGSIEPIGDGKIMLLTTEPGRIGWRSYNGYQYGSNVLELPVIGRERIPEIQDLQQATRALYDGHSGMLLFGRE